MAERCQGCGAVEGEPTVRFKGPKGDRKREEGLPVKLETVQLADYGERALCASCRRGAAMELKRLHEQCLALVWAR